MSQEPDTPQRNPLQLALAFALIFAVVGIAAWAATSAIALSLNSNATPTHSQPFAFVEIAKPITTPTALLANPLSPIIPPTDLVADLPTSSPSPLVLATVLETPTSLQTSEPILPVDLPTNSPIPITLATASQTPIPIQTSAPIVNSEIIAEIVVDTPPATGYSDTTQYDPPPSYGGNKYILVDISEQHMYVYEGDALVYSFVSSTGMNNATRAGYFSVLDKIPNAYGATWDIWMPNWLGIYWAGSMENGIHALPILPNGGTLWAGYLGVPISYGCVVLGTYESQLLYDWADIGTPVEIRW